jgi:hypothetical protein
MSLFRPELRNSAPERERLVRSRTEGSSKQMAFELQLAAELGFVDGKCG